MGQAGNKRNRAADAISRAWSAWRIDDLPITELTRQERINRRALRFIIRVVSIGAVMPAIYAIATGDTSLDSFAIIGVGLTIAGASLLVGAFLGFLFGIPISRLPVRGDREEGTTVAGAVAVDPATRRGYRPNTNLEEISDWLTKILVGVGLTQIGELSDRLGTLGDFLAPGLSIGSTTVTDASRVFAIALVVYFLLCGFLFVYLWTRIDLPRAFNWADDLEELRQSVQDITTQADKDALALSLNYRQLDPTAVEVSQDDLTRAISQASAPVKVSIFNLARQMRQENWQENGDKARLERTIPIFRALIADDTRGYYHRNYGQLGYALKDQSRPDWAGAEAALSRAIEIRDQRKDPGWKTYEFCRALCRIELARAAGTPIDPGARDAIMDDLRVASQESEVRGYIDDSPVITAWLAEHNLSPP